jgi:hypothetical protein
MKLIELDSYLLLNWIQEWISLVDFLNFITAECNQEARIRLCYLVKITFTRSNEVKYNPQKYCKITILLGLQSKTMVYQIIPVKSLENNSLVILDDFFTMLTSRDNNEDIFLLSGAMNIHSLNFLSKTKTEFVANNLKCLEIKQIDSYVFRKTSLTNIKVMYDFYFMTIGYWQRNIICGDKFVYFFYGQMEDYKPHGFGIATNFETNITYEGKWWQGKYHGSGELTTKDGSKFEGHWKHGAVELNMQNKKTYKNGGYFVGICNVHTNITGKATNIVYTYEKFVYSGDLLNEMRHGTGKIYVFYYLFQVISSSKYYLLFVIELIRH